MTTDRPEAMRLTPDEHDALLEAIDYLGARADMLEQADVPIAGTVRRHADVLAGIVERATDWIEQGVARHVCSADCLLILAPDLSIDAPAGRTSARRC